MVPLGFISTPLGRRDRIGLPRPYGGASSSVRGGAQRSFVGGRWSLSGRRRGL